MTKSEVFLTTVERTLLNEVLQDKANTDQFTLWNEIQDKLTRQERALEAAMRIIYGDFS